MILLSVSVLIGNPSPSRTELLIFEPAVRIPEFDTVKSLDDLDANGLRWRRVGWLTARHKSCDRKQHY